MVDAIITFFLETVGKELCVFFCSMIPVIELRGAIPMGVALGVPLWQNVLLSILGNMLPVPFILLFVEKFIHWASKSRIGFFNKCANFLLNKVEKKRAAIEKYSFWGVTLFVGIPLPGTGAWTGCLAAAFLDMRLKKAMPAVILGVLTAGTIMMTLTHVGINLFSGAI